MTREEIKAIRNLIIEGAKRTFDEDYGMLLEEDDTKIKEQERLDSYIEGAEDVLEIIEESFVRRTKMVAIDMEMPKSCSECNMCRFYNEFEGDDMYCSIDGNSILDAKQKRAFCPLKEIVTCKDCSIGGRECSNSGKYCIHIGKTTEDDFFCSDGERRE